MASATDPASESAKPTRWPSSQRSRRSPHDAPCAIALFTGCTRISHDTRESVTAIAAASVQYVER
jgi:hypothetical protein